MSRLRELVSAQLEGAVERVIGSYESFLSLTIDVGDAKEFAAHHSACKSALAHLDLLLRVARIAGVQINPEADGSDEEQQLLAAARAAVGGEEGDDHGDTRD